MGENSLLIASLWLALNIMVHKIYLEIVYFKSNAFNKSELLGDVEKRVVQ